MPTYSVHAINVGSFPLGESDKVLTLFSQERGIVRAVAKGARKPGTKLSGKSDVLSVNKLLLATGRSLDIITQAENIESYAKLRQDLIRLSFALYYAELTQHFGAGLSDESSDYFNYLCEALRLQAASVHEPVLLSLVFASGLLKMLGYKPELDFCVTCRKALADYNLAVFHHELSGIVCGDCVSEGRRHQIMVREKKERKTQDDYSDKSLGSTELADNNFKQTHITPSIWKTLVLASNGSFNNGSFNPALLTISSVNKTVGESQIANRRRAAYRAHRILQSYIEHKAGKRMRSLDLVTEAGILRSVASNL